MTIGKSYDASWVLGSRDPLAASKYVTWHCDEYGVITLMCRHYRHPYFGIVCCFLSHLVTRVVYAENDFITYVLAPSFQPISIYDIKSVRICGLWSS